MSARTIFLAVLLAPALAVAQAGDDWTTFPTEPPPPETTPAPQKPPAQAPAAAQQTQRTSAPSAATAGGQPVVVANNERTVPGTEPHSPSTLGRPWNAMQNRRLIPGPAGATGFVHTSSAALGPAGILRLGSHGEYFTGEFPVRDATHVRTAGNFVVAYQPLTWLEAYLGYVAMANTNSTSSPSLIQTLGDVTFGLKLSNHWGGGFHAGVDLRAHSFSGVGNQDVRNYAFGFSPRAVIAWDVRRAAPAVPIVFHLNAGVQLDQTGELVSGHPLLASEEYALGMNQYNRFIGRAALEFPIAVIAPYVEYAVGVPLGVEGGVVRSTDESEVPVAEVMPQTIGGGFRITAVKDLTLTVGADLGLARTVGLGIPATPPWMAYFGATFNVDPFQRGESKIIETVTERPMPVQQQVAQVEGVVLDAKTQQPLAGAIVAVMNSNAPPVATDASQGRFLTHEAGPGPVTLRVEKAGYKEATAEVVVEPGQKAAVSLALEPMAKVAHLAFNVVGGGRNKVPVAAEVKLRGPTEQSVQVPASPSDTRVEVPPGKYVVDVVAPEMLAQTREVQISENAEMRLAFELDPQPRKKLVVVKADKIDILQQVHFATGRATILRDSFSLLDQVVDAIVKSDIRRIRVEGHTDNRGSDRRNQRLSEQRAQAVADYLAKAGIDPSRIEVVGHGESKPIAPNLTARGRELNRRVEFVILER